MKDIAIIAAGGAIGASLRHLTGVLFLRLLGPGFPWATLTVNIVGGFAMGLLVELLARRVGASPELRLFMATGLLGGFTTFSAFSLEVALLWERGALCLAALYLAASVIGAVGALFCGLWLARALA
ncbi:fluoride efflux transporter CrcB [Nitratireductor sp. CAU 1489]|uniref:Fluoride-specific ion channel FluC n=1 Tax=Nitratireductor arenosus TaxID=2682096 RepID=A0A844QHS0_9HYPH|nr:fluoride efflux transporter CrcB [Nitratireductor arenosus]MVA97520.1 fluoride efflux transporter CrcB [Nitratireductor arenosus]